MATAESQSPDGMSPGNLDASVEALEILIDVGDEEKLTRKEAESIVNTASVLLSPNNQDAWTSILQVFLERISAGIIHARGALFHILF